MTIITRPNLVFKKATLLNGNNYDEEVFEIQPPSAEPYRRRSMVALLCMTLTALAVTVAGVMCGTVLYRQVLRSPSHRYQGYCTIPISTKQMDPAFIEQSYRVMPLRWTSEPDMQVVSLVDDGTSNQLMNILREELDIGDSVEKISVFEDGKKVNFIHDFNANVTGIVDSERCYLMELDPSLVLSPEMFILSIERGDQFDVSRVRHTLRASLPALSTPASLPSPDAPTSSASPPAPFSLLSQLSRVMDNCVDKPIYRLQLDDDPPAIRKRSVDAPPHDYIQFSGRHVQEIDISNLAQLLEEEQRARNNHTQP